MADRNTTGAVHLTSLDLDISGVRKSLEEIKSGIENTAREIPRIFNSTMSDSETVDWLKSIGISDKNIDSAKAKIQELAQEVGNFSKLQVTSKDGDLFQAIVTHSDKAGNSIRQVIDLTKNLKETTRKYTVTEDVSKLEKQYEQVERQIEKVTTKLSALEKVGKTGSIRKEATELKNEFQNLYNQVSNGTISVDEAKAKFSELGNSFEQLNLKARTATGGIDGLLLRLSEKAKWMLAYQFINLIQQALGNVIGTIRETEDATIELQRVLNNPPDTKAISDALYDIGYRYGQSFENVQQTAVLFAQTGQDWEQVLASVEATMLGLNTAELEVTTATNGLIAVMSQFHIEATDLEEVIDKINITADNFPITSEKIVAALQRAGGTAYNFGLTLEETIGVIAALGEATGRSGEQIGTALNSLISFSMKPSSLNKFSEFLGGVSLEGKNALEIWQLLGAKMDDSGEKLAKMMAGSKEFADLFSEEMATAIGLTDEYNAAMMNSQDVYSAVGTYRQNYFIGLINNIDRVIDVLNNMTDAEGYSMQENKKAMEAFSKQWEQLVNTAKQLAVEFGQAGFLIFLKWLVQAGIDVLKLTKNIGGLTAVCAGLATAFAIVKKEKINEHFKNITNAISSVKNAISIYNAYMQTGATSTQAMSAAVNALQISFGGWLAIAGLAITAIYSIVTAMEQAKEKEKEYRQEMIQAGKESKTQAKNLAEAYNQLKNAETSGIQSDVDKAQVSLLESLGYQESDIAVLEKRYGDLKTAIEELVEAEYKQLKVQADIAAQNAKESYKDLEPPKEISLSRENYNGWKDALDILKEYNKELDYTYKNRPVATGAVLSIDALNKIPKTAKEANEQIKELNSYIKTLEENMTSGELATNELYQAFVKQVGVLKDWVNTVDSAVDYAENLPPTFEEFAESVAKSGDGIEELAKKFDNGEASIVDFEKAIELLGEAFDELSGKVDDFQSAYSTVIDVIDEYNETGIMTADMLQKILELEPEYIAMIDVSTDSLGLNEQAVGNLINTNDNYLQQLIALKVAKESDAMASSILAAQNDNVAISEINAANAASTLQAQLQNAVIACINGTGSATDLANALRQVGQEAGLAGEYLEYFTQQGIKMANTLGSLYGKIKTGTIDTYYTPKVSSGSKKSGSTKNTALEAQKEQLQKEVDAWKKQKEVVNNYYKDLIENLKKQKQESDDYYDGLIDNLKKVEESNERINAQLDYYTNRQKLLRNIEQAQARSGIEWREKEADYQQQLVDLDEEWRKKLEDWSIEDRISELELLKKQAQDMVDAQIDELKRLNEAAVKEIENTISKLQESINELAKAISKSASSSINSGISSGISTAQTSVNNFTEKTKQSFLDMNKTIEYDSKRVLAAMREASKDPGKTAKEMYEFAIKNADLLTKKVDDATKLQGVYATNNFINPMIAGINSINSNLQTNLVKGAAVSASAMFSAYQQNLITPLQKQMSGAMAGASLALSSKVITTPSNTNTSKKSTVSNTNTVNMYNNITNTSSAQSAVKGVSNIFANPSRL